MPTTKRPISKAAIIKQVKTYYDAKLKKWFIIGFAILGVMGFVILFFIRKRDKEVQQRLELMQKHQQDLIQIAEQQKAKIIKDSIRNDSLEREFNRKQPVREKTIIQYQKQRDERINQIRNPSFSGNDDSIRAAFSKH